MEDKTAQEWTHLFLFCTLTKGHTPAWQALGWLIKHHPNHFLPHLPLLEAGTAPHSFIHLSQWGDARWPIFHPSNESRSQPGSGASVVWESLLLFWLRESNIASTALPPCLSSFICFQCRCHNGHLKTRADLQEGKTKQSQKHQPWRCWDRNQC